MGHCYLYKLLYISENSPIIVVDGFAGIFPANEQYNNDVF